MTRDDEAARKTSTPAADELAHELRRRRDAAGYSQPELARMIGYSRQYVSLAERKGKNVPSQGLVDALDRVLNASGALIALRKRAKAEQTKLRQGLGTASTGEVGDGSTPEQEVRGEHNSVNRRSFLAATGMTAFDTVTRRGTRALQALEVVTADATDYFGATVDYLHELTAHYSDKFAVSSPGDLYDDLLDLRHHVGILLKNAGAPLRSRMELTITAGRLSNLLAMTTSHMRDHESALVWCIDAERRSHEAGHREIAGWAALTKAMIAYYQGLAGRSAELAIGRHGVAQKGTAIFAKLAAHEMRARARLGDAEGAERAKARAVEAVEALPANVATTGAFSIALAEEPPYTATSLLHLGKFQEAASATRVVLRSAYPSGTENLHRNSSSYARTLLILGLAEAGSGNFTEAAEVGKTALEHSGAAWPTMVLASKLDKVLMRNHGEVGLVAEYHDLCLDMIRRSSEESQHLN